MLSPRNRRVRERVGVVAIALWFPTIVVGIWLFLGTGEPVDPADTRVALDLDDEQRATVLRTMRHNVDALNGVLAAWSRGDRAAMATAARIATQEHPQQVTPSLRSVLPPEWNAMGGQVDRGFDTFADDVAAGLPEAEIPGRLARITDGCVACHQLYRFR